MGCIFACLLKCLGIRGLPEDAAPLGAPERDDILLQLQGTWIIEPIDTGSGLIGAMAKNAGNSIVTFTGSTMLIGGIEPRYQEVFLSRTPDRKLYLDRMGSYVEDWNKAEGVMRINDAMGMILLLRKQRPTLAQTSAPVHQQPASQPIVLPVWWETMQDPSGKVYYKNNHNGTTSWTPPTPEQIAKETQERNAQAVADIGQTGGPPPPAYDQPPPAFSS